MAKRYRCLTCQAMTVNAVNPKTGRKQLFGFHKDSTGELVAEYDKPHVCHGGGGSSMTEAVVRRIVQEEVLGLNPKASEEAAKANKAADAASAADDSDDEDEAPLRVPTTFGSVNPAEVASIARMEVEKLRVELLEKLKPVVQRIVIVRHADGQESTMTDHAHPLFPRLLRYVAAGRNAYLYGAPGGGKSYAAWQTSIALKTNYGYIALGPMTPESKLFGFLDVNGRFIETPFFKCYKDGGVFCIDKMDNANDALLTQLNGALENKRCAFPCGVVDRHPNFVLVATGNTAGYGGTRGHAGRRAFDAATRERFAYIPWIYDESLEETLTMEVNNEAAAWMTWVREVRRFVTTHALDIVVSPRASIYGADMLAKGCVESAEELAEAVLFKGLESVQRSKILSACPLPRLEVR